MGNENLIKNIARGAGIIFLGLILGYIFKFAYRIIVSRVYGPEKYGLLSLGDMVLNIGILVAVIGLTESTIKYLSYYSVLGERDKAKGTFLGIFKITLILSLIFSILTFIFAEEISLGIFHNPELIQILRIFALIIPFYSLLLIFDKIFLVFKKPEYEVISVQLGRNLIGLILALIVVFIGKTIFHISLAYLASFVIAFVISAFLLRKIFPFFSREIKAHYNYKELLYFSLPLFFSGIFINIMSWADTFFLGFMKSAYDVGIYNVAMPLAASLAVFLSAFANIFFPIMNELKAKGNIKELEEIYSIVLKWLFMVSLPFVLIMLFFPKIILGVLFGNNYLAGSSVLVILVIANFINVITGPCDQVLMTFNKTRFIFYVNLSVAILNIILNIILIPIYGIIGAAIATGFALALRQVVFFLLSKRLIKFTYYSKAYIKYILSVVIPLILIYFLSKVINTSPIFLVLLGLLFFVLYLVFLLLFRSFSQEDFMIISSVEKKFGIKLGFLKRFIRN